MDVSVWILLSRGATLIGATSGFRLELRSFSSLASGYLLLDFTKVHRLNLLSIARYALSQSLSEFLVVDVSQTTIYDALD